MPAVEDDPATKVLLVKAIIFIQPALRALGLLLADGAPTVGGGKTF